MILSCATMETPMQSLPAATPRRRCARYVYHSCRIHVPITTFMLGVRQSTDRTTSKGAAWVHRCTAFREKGP